MKLAAPRARRLLLIHQAHDAETLMRRVPMRVFAISLGADRDEVLTFEQLLARPPWHTDAACRGRPDLDWFPGSRVDVSDQRAVCRSCLVRDECLAWALDQSDVLDGVWSGTTKGQRRAMRKARRSSAA